MTVFTFTFIVFPGVALETNLDFLAGTGNQEKSWFALVVPTVFNIGDTVSRITANKTALFSGNQVWLPILLRAVFIFTMLMIAFDQSPDWLFGSDWFKIINLFLFSVTNGYLSTLCMKYGPELCADEDKEIAGFLMVFSLTGGVLLGSLIATFAIQPLF